MDQEASQRAAWRKEEMRGQGPGSRQPPPAVSHVTLDRSPFFGQFTYPQINVFFIDNAFEEIKMRVVKMMCGQSVKRLEFIFFFPAKVTDCNVIHSRSITITADRTHAAAVKSMQCSQGPRSVLTGMAVCLWNSKDWRKRGETQSPKLRCSHCGQKCTIV